MIPDVVLIAVGLLIALAASFVFLRPFKGVLVEFPRDGRRLFIMTLAASVGYMTIVIATASLVESHGVGVWIWLVIVALETPGAVVIGVHNERVRRAINRRAAARL